MQLTSKINKKFEVLVDPNLDLTYQINGIADLASKLKAQNCRFADSFYLEQTTDTFNNFDALLGSDVIPFIQPLKTVKVMNGFAYKIIDGVILFGDISNYDENVLPFASCDSTINCSLNSDANICSDVTSLTPETDASVSSDYSNHTPSYIGCKKSSTKPLVGNIGKPSIADCQNYSSDPLSIGTSQSASYIGCSKSSSEAQTPTAPLTIGNNARYSNTGSYVGCFPSTSNKMDPILAPPPINVKNIPNFGDNSVKPKSSLVNHTNTLTRDKPVTLSSDTDNVSLADASEVNVNDDDSEDSDIHATSLSDEMLDKRVEQLFKIESLGLNPQNDISTPDEKLIENFEKSIEYTGNKYLVEIPWKDNIDDVPSNWEPCLAQLNRVYESLEKKNLVDGYNKVFDEHIDLGIVDILDIDPSQYPNYTFIPHHPVIKTDSRSTTKIRAVFNCSYQCSKNVPSLNTACNVGVDMLADLLNLLLLFRQDKYVLISDVEKAYLRCFLKSEETKNRFCFFRKVNGQIQVLRYKTLIFGLNFSCAALHLIIRHHLNKYPSSVTTESLKHRFYVDNFCASFSDPSVVEEVYTESVRIMAEGGFNLRSHVTNVETLRDTMERDGKYTKNPTEKVFGYDYDYSRDKLKLGLFDLGSDDRPTKRKVLSVISSVYEPLGLTLPVTIFGRILMQKIWTEQTAWDEKVSDDIYTQFKILRNDLTC